MSTRPRSDRLPVSGLSFSRMNSPISRATSYSSLSLSLVCLSGAIGQLLFDSTVWWFEPAQSQLRRQIIHHTG
jgi:hypothetical protein